MYALKFCTAPEWELCVSEEWRKEDAGQELAERLLGRFIPKLPRRRASASW